MNSGIPILMISLQIPVLPDTDAEDVLQAIGMQVAQALEAIREQQNGNEETEGELEIREVVTTETLEPFSEGTRDDLLATLGYASKSDD